MDRHNRLEYAEYKAEIGKCERKYIKLFAKTAQQSIFIKYLLLFNINKQRAWKKEQSIPSNYKGNADWIQLSRNKAPY